MWVQTKGLIYKRETIVMRFKKGERVKGSKQFSEHPENINRKGRPRKLPELEIILAEVLSQEKNGKTAAEQVIEALRKKAIAGDARAIELLLNRAYGKVPDRFDVTTNGKELPAPNFNFMPLEDE